MNIKENKTTLKLNILRTMLAFSPTKAKVILSGALEQSPNTPSRDR